MVGTSAYDYFFQEDISRIAKTHVANLDERRVVMQVTYFRMKMGYTTLSAIAACAGLTLEELMAKADSLVEMQSHSNLDSDASTGGAIGDAGTDHSHPEQASGDSTNDVSGGFERVSVHVPGIHPSLLGVVSQAASKRLPSTLVRPLEEIHNILRQGEERAGGESGIGITRDVCIPVCRWMTARSCKDGKGKFFINIWRPMSEDQTGMERMVGAQAWNYVTLPFLNGGSQLKQDAAEFSREKVAGANTSETGKPSAQIWDETVQRTLRAAHVKLEARAGNPDMQHDPVLGSQTMPISFAEFKMLRMLGKGAFGTVY